MKNILELALSKCQDAELYSIKMEKYPVAFAGNRLKSIKSQIVRRLSLRVKVDGRLGFASDTTADDPQGFVARAMETAVFGAECPFDFHKSDAMAKVDLFDPRTVTFDMEDGVEIGQKIIEKMKKACPDSTNDIRLIKYFLEVTYMSGSVEKTYYKTLFAWDISNMQVKEDGLIYMDEYDSSCRIPDDFSHIGNTIISKMDLVSKAYEMPSKKMQVVFHPKATGNLIRPLTAGLSGISLVSGTSPMVGKLNEVILDEKFSMVDDPLIPFAAESESFDGEGLVRKRLPLYENGVLKNYLLDLSSANTLGLEPNGCAGREPDAPPTPGTSNLVITPGNTPIEELIKGIDEGLLVEDVIGGGQANTIAGEFSVNVSLGFRIKNGELLGRVRNTMIAGNAYELLKNNLGAFSVETMRVGSTITPYMLINDVSVSGKE
ncbi:MAG: TldD/PmbA family protein [Firmicutes bacterium]|nr:TldD/PmbA family protein [Bacillota bacterium]